MSNLPNLYRDITINQVKLYKKEVNWYRLSMYAPLKVLESFSKNLKFSAVSNNPNLSDNFIRKYQHKLDFRYISIYCSLEILIQFEDKIDWENASKNKNLFN